jgi:prepilin-type N-terminal cleavage/methylation domain-containing protein
MGRRGGNKSWKIKSCDVGRVDMALKKETVRARRQRGMSLMELMIAMTVLMVGVAGCLVAIPFASKTNFGNRQLSNATVLAQMVTEKIMSVPVGTTSTTITDCAGTANTVNTAAGGESVLSSGSIDYTATTSNGYFMNYTTCGSNGQQMVYDVRWNIQALGDTKLISVSAKLNRAGTQPATIRSMIGTGN